MILWMVVGGGFGGYIGMVAAEDGKPLGEDIEYGLVSGGKKGLRIAD